MWTCSPLTPWRRADGPAYSTNSTYRCSWTISCSSGGENGWVPVPAIRSPCRPAISPAEARNVARASTASSTVAHVFVASSTTEANNSVLSTPGSPVSSVSRTSTSTEGESASVSASRIINSSSIPTVKGELDPNRCSIIPQANHISNAVGQLRSNAGGGLSPPGGPLSQNIGEDSRGTPPAA